MDWLRARAPDFIWVQARVIFILAALIIVAGGALWLLGEGGLLAVGGAVLAGLVVWEAAGTGDAGTSGEPNWQWRKEPPEHRRCVRKPALRTGPTGFLGP